MDPLVTVIIPAFNAEEHIARPLKSILDQDYSNIEVVVVDDGSLDHTAEVARSLLEGSSREFQISRQANGGVSSARNHGLELARGRYVMFLDADDYLDRSAIRKMVRLAEDANADSVVVGYTIVDLNGQCIQPFTKRFRYLDGVVDGRTVVQTMLRRKTWVWTGSVMYRTAFLQHHGLAYTVGCTSAEDQEFNFKAMYLSKRVAFVPESLSYYVQQPGSLTRRAPNMETVWDSVYVFERLANFAVAHHDDALHDVFRYFMVPYAVTNVVARLAMKSDLSNEELMRLTRSSEYVARLRSMRLPFRTLGLHSVKVWFKVRWLQYSPRIYIRYFRRRVA